MSFNSFRIDIPGPPHRYATPSPPLSAVEPISPAFPRGLLDEASFLEVSTKLGAQNRLRPDARYTSTWNANNGDETESEDGSPDLPTEEDGSRTVFEGPRERKDSASTIDALATIALATSPTFASQFPAPSMSPAPSLFSRDSFRQSVERQYGYPLQGPGGTYEGKARSSKRARSEAISPQKTFDNLRRPMMSPFTPSSGSLHQHHHSVDSALDDRTERDLAAKNSRYEAMNTDAELLLNLARGVSFSPVQERSAPISRHQWGNPSGGLGESSDSLSQPPISQARKPLGYNKDNAGNRVSSEQKSSMSAIDSTMVNGRPSAEAIENRNHNSSSTKHWRMNPSASPTIERLVSKHVSQHPEMGEFSSTTVYTQQNADEVTPSPTKPKMESQGSNAIQYSIPVPSQMKIEERHALLLAASSPANGMDDVLRDDQNNTHLSHEAETLAGQGAVCAGCNFSRNTLDGDTNDATSWISCDGCKRWFHFACAGFKNEREVRSVDKFNCRECRPTCGPTTFVRKSSRAHTAIDYAELNEGIIRVTDESPEHHYIKPIKEGTIKFLPDNFLRMPPELVTADFFEKGNGMKEPVVIPAHLNPRPQVWASAEDVKRYPEQPQEPAIENGDDGSSDILYDEVPDVGQDALDMVIPQNLSVQDVAELYGPEEKVEVIDVKSQEGEGKNWNMRRWADYYESKGDKVIRNVISLEVSSSKLGRLIRRPKVVRDLDLQDSVWPAEGKAKGDFPKVQFYCLMSVADCFTDFHIDFGGSSVFYHVLKGKKTFFFISPKQKNLKKYEEWCMSPAQNWTFLPDQTKECYRVDLSEGDTMLIPSGWIHAVWTPENSLVIGGNFLTRLNYGMQIRIAEVEKATKVARKFRYPHFQKVLWYTAIKYLEDDPLPESVINDFYSGRKFSRETPTYYDFNKWGDNSTPGAENYHSRYYSQYELEGLPDLARYLLRTALISMGNITDGITVDTRNAVTRSIPKGHGEPLQIVKNFAMWSAWKRGNEHIPHWAYPDVVPAEALPKSQGKKLSAAAIKKLERQAAMEAYRAAPERQSVRQQSQAEAAALKRADGSPTKVEPVWGEDRKRKASTSSTANGVMDGHTPKRPKKALSTPKTSVLGPRRVACDACRRRRIRCKHKDDLLSGSATSHHGAPSVFVPVTGYPTFSRDLNSDFGPDYSVQNGEVPSFVTNSSRLPTEAIQATNVASGDQAPMQTPDARKIRNKACSNCRKSKRRCIHDEYGNVDPIKVQEASMSRTSGASAKRRAKVDEQDPRAPKKVKREVGISNEPAIIWPSDEKDGRVPVPAIDSNTMGTTQPLGSAMSEAAPAGFGYSCPVSSSDIGQSLEFDQVDGLIQPKDAHDKVMSRSSTPSTIIADDIPESGFSETRRRSVESSDDVQLVPASPSKQTTATDDPEDMRYPFVPDTEEQIEPTIATKVDGIQNLAANLPSAANDDHPMPDASMSHADVNKEDAQKQQNQEQKRIVAELDVENGLSKGPATVVEDQQVKIELNRDQEMDVESPLTSPLSDGRLSTPSVRHSSPLSVAESDHQNLLSAETDHQRQLPPALNSRDPDSSNVTARHSSRQPKAVQRFSTETLQGSYNARQMPNEASPPSASPNSSNKVKPSSASGIASSRKSSKSKKSRSHVSPNKINKRTQPSSASPSHSRHGLSISPTATVKSAAVRSSSSASLSPSLRRTINLVDKREEDSVRLARELAATQFSLRRRS